MGFKKYRIEATKIGFQLKWRRLVEMCRDCCHEWLGLVEVEVKSVASHVQIPRFGEEVTNRVGRSTTERHWRRQRREQLGPAVAPSGGSGSGRRTRRRRRRVSRGMIAMVFCIFLHLFQAYARNCPGEPQTPSN